MTTPDVDINKIKGKYKYFDCGTGICLHQVIAQTNKVEGTVQGKLKFILEQF